MDRTSPGPVRSFRCRCERGVGIGPSARAYLERILGRGSPPADEEDDQNDDAPPGSRYRRAL